MITAEKTIVIDKPVSDVFEFLADFENDPAWREEIDQIHHVGGPAKGVGAEYTQEIVRDGHKAETTFHVTEFRKNKHIAIEGDAGDVHAVGSYDFTSKHGATVLKLHSEIDLTGAIDPAEDVIGEVVQQIGEQDLRNLKLLLEQGG